jgi:anti-sigma regulatory factor (Ser/Thr protein kinase)
MTTRSLDKMTGDAGAIPAARRQVKSMIAEIREDLAATAELLTDELLTNAVQHGGGKFYLVAKIEADRLRVVVSDVWPSAPVTVYPSGHQLERGRGMTIVDAMASSWGIERSDSRKAVWFELDLA